MDSNSLSKVVTYNKWRIESRNLLTVINGERSYWSRAWQEDADSDEEEELFFSYV